MSYSSSSFKKAPYLIDFVAPKRRKKDVRVFINGRPQVSKEYYLKDDKGEKETAPFMKTDSQGWLLVRTRDQYKPVKMTTRHGFCYKPRPDKSELGRVGQALRSLKDATIGSVSGKIYLDVSLTPEFTRDLIRKTDNGETAVRADNNPVIEKWKSANHDNAVIREAYHADNLRREATRSGAEALDYAYYGGLGLGVLAVAGGVTAVTLGAAAPIIAVATPFFIGGSVAGVAKSRSGLAQELYIRRDYCGKV